jgi:hypothetical protein
MPRAHHAHEPVRLVDPPLHGGGTPDDRIHRAATAANPDGVATVGMRAARTVAGGRVEQLSLVFSVATVFVTRPSVGLAAPVLEVGLGKGVRGRGAACLTMRVGVERCGKVDPKTLYIVCVSAGLRWRGAELVSLATAFAHWVGCDRIVLSDGAIVGCATGEIYDLSLFILLRHGVTWYMRFGFHPAIHPGAACAGVDRALTVANRRIFEKMAAKITRLTCAEVVADAKLVLKMVTDAQTAGKLTGLQFDELSVWKRHSKIDANDARFEHEHMQAIFAVSYHMQAIVQALPRGKKAAVPLVAWLLKLQSENCSTYFAVYSHLFDNDTYYWRSRRCMYHMRMGGARASFRLSAYLQTIAAVQDPTESGQMWYEKIV